MVALVEQLTAAAVLPRFAIAAVQHSGGVGGLCLLRLAAHKAALYRGLAEEHPGCCDQGAALGAGAVGSGEGRYTLGTHSRQANL